MQNKTFLSALFLGAFSFMPFSAQATTTLSDAETWLKEGRVFGEVRARYEHVDQDNALSDADAYTVRTNLGFETAPIHGFKALIEGQIVRHLGSEDFNSTENGRSTFSVVADPDVVQVNRLWVEYNGIPDTSIKAGRQFLNLDNQRFVGAVGWRQNDQTFDAARIINQSIPGLELQYSYVDNVERIFDGGAQPGSLESNTHLAHASYKVNDLVHATGYAYFMDFDNVAGRTGLSADQSNNTYGVRFTGKAPINEDWMFSYEAEAATQEDAGDSTLNYNENYYHIAPKVSGQGFTFGLGYEVLEGDGTSAFRTPLATLHKFNGWADVFLNTPANGLEDAYIMWAYKVSNTNTLADGVKLTAIYHDFEGEEGGDFGNELDLSLGKTFTLPENSTPFKKISALIKYADYNADDAPYVDTEKVWLQIGLKF